LLLDLWLSNHRPPLSSSTTSMPLQHKETLLASYLNLLEATPCTVKILSSCLSFSRSLLINSKIAAKAWLKPFNAKTSVRMVSWTAHKSKMLSLHLMKTVTILLLTTSCITHSSEVPQAIRWNTTRSFSCLILPLNKIIALARVVREDLKVHPLTRLSNVIPNKL